MERKEPVIDSRAVDLTDRVKLTWPLRRPAS